MRDDTLDANEMFIRSQPPIKTRLEIESTMSRMESLRLQYYGYSSMKKVIHSSFISMHLRPQLSLPSLWLATRLQGIGPSVYRSERDLFPPFDC
jgi:hypothetical protein